MAHDEFLQVKQGPDLAPQGRNNFYGSNERVPDASLASDGIHTAVHTALTRPSTASSYNPGPVDNTKRPPPFSRKVTKSLFFRPADKRGTPPGYKQSLWACITYSWINVLLVCNPIAWALHFARPELDTAIFVLSLLGIIPLAGMLTFGTEAIALYTGDAVGGLINASLGNATEFIIAILLLVKCQIKVVQASLLGGLLSNLLLVLGMAFVVGGLRFSEQEFLQTAAQLNTSLLTLAVIALIIPTAFAYALETAVGPDAENDVILEMSRGSSVILIFIYITYMVFQLYSHTHYYNPNMEEGSDTSLMTTVSAPGTPTHERTRSDAESPKPHQHQSAPLKQLYPARRANSLSALPFGSAARIGASQPAFARSGSRRGPKGADRERGRTPARGRSPVRERSNETEGAVMENEDVKEVRRRDFGTDEKKRSEQYDVEAARPRPTRQETGSSLDEVETPKLNPQMAIIVLLSSTALTYLTAEALTDALEKIGEGGAVSPEWLGLILLAVVGNAAEHVTAVFVAYKNKVDLALAVAVGSCIQISLFVIPVLVLIGWMIGKPMSLLFDPLEVITLFLSVLLVRFATEDGRTHYMSGVALVGTYILIAFSFWYYPDSTVRDVGTCTFSR